MAIVYQHKRLDTDEIFYIGIGKTKERAYNKTNHRNNHWYNIINKTEYEVEILYENLTWKEACNIEINLIKEYGRKDLGLGSLVNMTDGGDGHMGGKHSEETKLLMSKSRLGKKRSMEARINISKGKLGKKLSDNHKKNLSISSINKFENGFISNLSKKIIDTNSNIIYNSLKEACKELNLNYGTMRNKMCGHRTNKTTLKYLEHAGIE